MRWKPEELTDYKFYCFNGEPLYCQLIKGRYSEETIDFYDMNWQHQSFIRLGFPHKPNPKENISCRKTLFWGDYVLSFKWIW